MLLRNTASYPQSKNPDNSAAFPKAIPRPLRSHDISMLADEPVAVLELFEKASAPDRHMLKMVCIRTDARYMAAMHLLQVQSAYMMP